MVPGLASSSSTSSSSLRTPTRQESHSSSSSSSPSSPAVFFWFEKGKIHLTVTSPQCQCLNSLMIDRGNLRKSKTTKSQKPKKRPRSNGETFVTILRFRTSYKNSWKFWWMMKFHYREALTPVLLMKPL